MKKTILVVGIAVILYPIQVLADAGYALQFDGIDDCVICGNHEILRPEQALTVEAWFIPDGYDSYTLNHIVGIGAGANPYTLCLRSDAGRLNFVITTLESGRSTIYTDIDPYLGQWNHVAGTYDGNTMRLYLNGNLVDSTAKTGAIDYALGQILYIGADDDNSDSIPDYCYHNQLDEIRIWNVARSQEDIQSAMNAHISGNESGLVGYWRLNTGSGDIAYDLSPNNIEARLGLAVGSDSADPFWILSTAPLNSKAWYVATDGNDQIGYGSEISPFKTIQHGIDVASSNDTVLVIDGTYMGEGNRDIIIPNKKLIIKSQNGWEYTTINCERSQEGNHDGFHVNYSDFDGTVEGFTITNSYIGIINQGRDPLIKNCRIINGGVTGILSYGNVHIDNCVVANFGYGMKINNFGSTPGVIIDNCTIVDNGYGIRTHIGRVDQTLITNSIIWGNLWADVEPDTMYPTCNYCDVMYGWTGYDNIYCDPQFCCANVGNYHLSEISCCVGAGPGGTNIGALGIGCDITLCKQYLAGDANMPNGIWPPSVIGADVTYLVNFFRGLNSTCLLDGFYASADINGDCLIIGSDVTRLVNYFRGEGDISYCPDFPPTWLTPSDLPYEIPEEWPGCDVY